MNESVSALEPLRPDHDLASFASGEAELDDWLRRRAAKNGRGDASRTYVVCGPDSARVVAYYCLAAGAMQAATGPGGICRNMPDLIPVMVLGRFAVDRTWQGRGLGSGLLRDAILRSLQVAEIVGVRALLVHALSDRATTFYRERGFRPSPVSSATLMLPLADIKKIVGMSDPAE